MGSSRPLEDLTKSKFGKYRCKLMIMAVISETKREVSSTEIDERAHYNSLVTIDLPVVRQVLLDLLWKRDPF